MRLNQIKKVFEAFSASDEEMYGDLNASETSSDKWLKKYTLENVDKWPSSKVVSELLDQYPFDGGVIYRGLNFENVKQWEAFKSETQNLTVLETGSISSWSDDAQEARSFAITRPTYFLDRELMQAESLKQKNRDYMIGYVGVILKIKIPAGVGIDVRKSPYAKESEIILAPGKYSISVDTKLIPFTRDITTTNFKDHFLAIKSVDGEDIGSKKFNHIMFHYKDFDDEMKKHLFALIGDSIADAKFRITVSKETDEAEWMDKNAKPFPTLEIGWTIPHSIFVYYAMLLREDQIKIDTQIISVLKSLNASFDEKLRESGISAKDRFKIKISPTLVMAVKLERFEKYATFINTANKQVGDRYNDLNSYASVKAINTMTDPKEKAKAIEKMTQNILQTLSQFN